MWLSSLPHYASLGSAAALDAVKVIHYVYPPVLLVYFAGALCATFWFQQKETHSARNAYRGTILWVNLGVLLTYVRQPIFFHITNLSTLIRG